MPFAGMNIGAMAPTGGAPEQPAVSFSQTVAMNVTDSRAAQSYAQIDFRDDGKIYSNASGTVDNFSDSGETFMDTGDPNWANFDITLFEGSYTLDSGTDPGNSVSDLDNASTWYDLASGSAVNRIGNTQFKSGSTASAITLTIREKANPSNSDSATFSLNAENTS